MCPECDKYCPYWKLDKSCSVSKVAYLFDNYGTVVFSIVMSIWGEYLRNNEIMNFKDIHRPQVSNFKLHNPFFYK